MMVRSGMSAGMEVSVGQARHKARVVVHTGHTDREGHVAMVTEAMVTRTSVRVVRRRGAAVGRWWWWWLLLLGGMVGLFGGERLISEE